jgi:equilibrative nucleoside transporter 1/2/3
VSDYLGRTYLPTIPWLFLQDAKHVMFASLARTLFIPIFMLCNTVFAGTSTTPHIPLVNSDVLYFAILLLFGATNGLVLSHLIA